MVCISLDVLLNLSTILAIVLMLAKYANSAIKECLALQYLTVYKGRHDKQCRQYAGEMSASDTVGGSVNLTMSTSACRSEGTAESVNILVRGSSLEAPEPMAHSTADRADCPQVDKSSEGNTSESDLPARDLDVSERQSKSHALSAPSQSQRCVHSESDSDMCQTRTGSRTLGAFSKPLSCERQVNSILNKLTRERFESLYQQLHSICSGEDFNQKIINVIAHGVFAKATVQHTFAEMYAEVCFKLYIDFAAQSLSPGIAAGFKRSLLEQCQVSFKVYLQPPLVDKSLSEEDQFEQLTRHKTKMLGNVRLIAHLIRQKMLSPRMIFDCTDELLKVGSAETLESLCTFVSTLDDFFYAPEWHNHVQVLVLFSRIRLLSEDATQVSRIRFLMQNVLDTRNKRLSERVKQLPVLLGRSGSARGGDAPTSEDMKRKGPEKTRDGPAKQTEHANVQKEKSDKKANQCYTKPGQEISLAVALDSKRTALRTAASFFKPTVSNQEEYVAEAAPKTSVMLRNVPAELSRSSVLDVLRSKGFAMQIRFVYVPMNLRTKCSFGYAFVDFDSMKTAERCMEQLEGLTPWSEQGEKPLELAWSDTQGLDAQIARYRDSPLMHESVADEMKPALYEKGARIAFPAPTKAIRAPRLRKVVDPAQ